MSIFNQAITHYNSPHAYGTPKTLIDELAFTETEVKSNAKFFPSPKTLQSFYSQYGFVEQQNIAYLLPRQLIQDNTNVFIPSNPEEYKQAFIIHLEYRRVCHILWEKYEPNARVKLDKIFIKEEHPTCHICMEEDWSVQKLEHCSHHLHQTCRDKLIKNGNQCPICKSRIDRTKPIPGVDTSNDENMARNLAGSFMSNLLFLRGNLRDLREIGNIGDIGVPIL